MGGGEFGTWVCFLRRGDQVFLTNTVTGRGAEALALDGHPDVADLVGECFLVALQASHRYVAETDTALPWLFGISRRLLAKQRRKYAGNRRLEVKASNAFPSFTAAEDEEVASAIDAARQAPLLEEALHRAFVALELLLEQSDALLEDLEDVGPRVADVDHQGPAGLGRIRRGHRLDRVAGPLHRIGRVPGLVDRDPGHRPPAAV